MRTWRKLAPAAVPFIILVLGLLVFAYQSGPSARPFGAAQPQPGAGRGFLPRAETRPAQPAGPLERAGQWVLETQQQLNGELAAAVQRIRSADPGIATMMLAALSFAYGVLHAAGPGHGKAVISSYVLADGRTVRRGIVLAFLAALIQAVSALIVIAVLVLLLRSTGLQIRAMEARLETVSWALVACFGTWLLYRQLKSALRPVPARSSHAHHHEQDAPCAGCAHVSAPSELQGAWSWRRALALALAVGVRPCTGALLVLVFAIGQGLLWAGIFSTLAMALGTAITVSVLAASAVGFREVAARLAGGGSSKWADRVQLTAGIGGAGLVLVLGEALFLVSLGASRPF
jgi:nickel/cobalt transporter (NicO) family protein